MFWCQWYTITEIMLRVGITHAMCSQVDVESVNEIVGGIWYLVNDSQVEPIACPYVDSRGELCTLLQALCIPGGRLNRSVVTSQSV